ncbi:hypothetical protein BPSP16_09655 [Brachyspira pilosicoli SP16]|nr:hypothetical protein BPSP16_09655 [Brachyspira pilosicoli SP16]
MAKSTNTLALYIINIYKINNTNILAKNAVLLLLLYILK